MSATKSLAEDSKDVQDYMSKNGLQWDPRFPNTNQTR